MRLLVPFSAPSRWSPPGCRSAACSPHGFALLIAAVQGVHTAWLRLRARDGLAPRTQ